MFWLHLLETIFTNLLAGLLIAATTLWFVAWQRSKRLRIQLADLARLIVAPPQNDPMAIFQPFGERKREWDNELAQIQTDLAKMPDRFVRLNAESQKKLDRLLTYDGLNREQMRALIQRLEGDISVEADSTETIYKRKVLGLRDSLSWTNFFEC